MKEVVFILLLASLSAAGQDSRKEDGKKIYHHIIHKHLDRKTSIINEIFTPLKKYDVDGNYERWFYQSFKGVIICVIPIQYEKTVIEFLESRNVNLDTGSIFRQIETAKVDSLSKYNLDANLIPSSRAPLGGHSLFGNLFKKKKAVGLSPVYFDERNNLALVKIQIYSRTKQSAANPSQIIILQKQDGEWKTMVVIPEK